MTGLAVGCERLLEACNRVRPDFCVTGHIHECYGVTQSDGTTYINASSCTMLYRCDHEPIVFDVVVK